MNAQWPVTKARCAVAEMEMPVFQQSGHDRAPTRLGHVADDLRLADAANPSDVGLQHLDTGGQHLLELEAGGEPLAVGDRHRGALRRRGRCRADCQTRPGFQEEAIELSPIPDRRQAGLGVIREIPDVDHERHLRADRLRTAATVSRVPVEALAMPS